MLVRLFRLFLGLLFLLWPVAAKAQEPIALDAPVTVTQGWKFFANRLVPPVEIVTAGSGENVSIPHVWKGMADGGPGGAYGIGTYARTIRLAGNAREYGLRPGKVRSVYHFYAVVQEASGPRVYDLGGNGDPGFEREAQAKGRLFYTPLPFDTTEFTLVVQVSNHMHSHVGYLWAPVIGPKDMILQSHERRIGAFWAFSGIVAATGLFTMFLAIWHTGSNYYFIGGGMLVILALRLLFVQNYIYIAFPDLPMTLAYRLEYVGIWVMMPSLYWLAYGLYPQEASRRLVGYLWLIAFIATVVTFTQPVSAAVAIRDPYLWFSGVCWLLVLAVFLRARSHERDGATWAVYGHIGIAVGMISDTVLYLPVPKASVEAIPIVAVLFCVMLMGLFTVRYKLEQQEKARLAASLETANEALSAHAERLDQAQSQAAAALEMKNSFLSNISHEVQTPLKSIVNFADLLVSQSHGPVDTEKRREYLRLIRDNGENLLRLLDDILSVSDLEIDRFDVAAVKTDPCSIIDLVLAIVEPVAHDKHILVDARCEPTIMMTDQRLMRQALVKILSNAVKFSPVNGVVTVRGSAAADAYMFTITDTGPGMDPKDIPKAMSLFGRVGDDGMGEQGGLGLGLPLVSRFMELAGGDLRIDSIPDLGTTVTLTFPLELASARR